MVNHSFFWTISVMFLLTAFLFHHGFFATMLISLQSHLQKQSQKKPTFYRKWQKLTHCERRRSWKISKASLTRISCSMHSTALRRSHLKIRIKQELLSPNYPTCFAPL